MKKFLVLLAIAFVGLMCMAQELRAEGFCP